jgi:hypothetical protein
MPSDQLITIPALCISIDLLTGCSLREIIGRPLVVHWSSIGRPLVVHWSSIGRPLVVHWSSIGFTNLVQKPEYPTTVLPWWGILNLLRKSADRRISPYPRQISHGFRDRDTKGGVAVQDRDAHLNLGDLAVEVPCHQALAG